jgi:hypothetical protein
MDHVSHVSILEQMFADIDPISLCNASGRKSKIGGMVPKQTHLFFSDIIIWGKIIKPSINVKYSHTSSIRILRNISDELWY